MGKRLLYPRMVFAAIAGVFAASQAVLNAQQSAEAVRVGKDAIGGVVSSTNGPEAGVWVIAETTDLPTKFVYEAMGSWIPSQCRSRLAGSST